MTIQNLNTEKSVDRCTTQLLQSRRLRHGGESQRGSSMVEFVIVTPLLFFLGLGIMQFGLVYHAKSMLNYATFEAARAGAVNNGQTDIMRKELGYRMAPVFGGSGDLSDGVSAVVRSTVYAQDPSITKIEILNPTSSAYLAYGETKNVTDSHKNVRPNMNTIPNSHMRVRKHDGKDGGLNIQDANLLKIRVTYGYQMRLPFLDIEVPGVTWTMRNFLIQSDPDNWMYYMRGMLPIKATATVRMQSEAWEGQLDPIAIRMFDAMYAWTKEKVEELRNGNNDGEDGPGGACNQTIGLREDVPLDNHDFGNCAANNPNPRPALDFGIDPNESDAQSSPIETTNTNQPIQFVTDDGETTTVPDGTSLNSNQSLQGVQADPLVGATEC